jgi:hypothetical protein
MASGQRHGTWFHSLSIEKPPKCHLFHQLSRQRRSVSSPMIEWLHTYPTYFWYPDQLHIHHTLIVEYDPQSSSKSDRMHLSHQCSRTILLRLFGYPWLSKHRICKQGVPIKKSREFCGREKTSVQIKQWIKTITFLVVSNQLPLFHPNAVVPFQDCRPWWWLMIVE